MPELMTSPAPVVTPTPTPTPSPTPTPTSGGTPAPGGANGSQPTAPKPIKISYEDGEAETELSLIDESGESKSEPPGGFKFEQLDALKDSHPDLYKAVKAELSKGSRYSKHFKTPEEAKSTLDRVGRLAEQLGDRGAGLDAIEGALARQTAALNAARNGDKSVVEAWFKESPEGMSEFTTHALEQLSKADPKLADSISGKSFVNALVQKDIYGQSALDALNALYNHVADKPDARKLLDRVAATVNQHNTNSQYKPDTTARQSAALDKREAAVFAKQIDLAADEVVRPAASRALAALTAEVKGLTSEERAEYRDFMVTEFYKGLEKIPGVKQKYLELVRDKDQAGIVALIKANRSKVMNEAVKSLYKAKLLNRESIRAEASSKTEGISGGVGAPTGRVTQKWTGPVHPERGPKADFDYDRMNSEGIQALDRQFFIKGRKELFTW